MSETVVVRIIQRDQSTEFHGQPVTGWQPWHQRDALAGRCRTLADQATYTERYFIESMVVPVGQPFDAEEPT